MIKKVITFIIAAIAIILAFGTSHTKATPLIPIYNGYLESVSYIEEQPKIETQQKVGKNVIDEHNQKYTISELKFGHGFHIIDAINNNNRNETIEYLIKENTLGFKDNTKVLHQKKLGSDLNKANIQNSVDNDTASIENELNLLKREI